MRITIKNGVTGGKINAIPSKSDAHRLLICAALADKETRLICPFSSEDIDATAGVLVSLGTGITRDSEGFAVKPIEKLPESCTLDCGESGSTLRFLLPVAAALGAKAEFFGRGRLPLRPMDELYGALIKGGAKISNGCKLPFSLEGKLKAGHYEIGGGVSSQYLSGLLMGLPLLGGDSTVTVTGGLQSKGYVDMTLHALARFGVDVQRQGDCFFIPGGRPYKSPGQLSVEGDFSNGAFFLVMGALLEDGLLVKGLPEGTLQGDRAILTVLEEMGAHVEHTPDGIFVKKKSLCGTVIDAQDIPDLVPVLAVAGALAEGKTTFVNAGRLRAKESDRIKTVCKMITDLGGRAEEHAEGLTVWGGLTGGTVFGAGDHRIVMSAAVASAVCPVTIDGAEAVNKSYPIFFDHLLSLGAKVVTE